MVVEVEGTEGDFFIEPGLLESEFDSAFRWPAWNFHSGFLNDVIVNFVGFIPLGFVFMMTFVKARGYLRRRYLGMTVFLCFTLSLTMEVLQAWIPSRSSDCLDLLLNTLGAFIGTMIFVWSYGRCHWRGEDHTSHSARE